MKFKKRTDSKASMPRAKHNIERLKWLDEGKTFTEIRNHPEHYQNPILDLNYDIRRGYIDLAYE